MSSLHDNPFLLASGSPTDPTFPLQRSVRLRSSASAYFNRTAGTATSTTTWTWSAWVKRGTIGTTQVLFSGGTSASNNACIAFTSDSLDVYNFISSVIKARKITTQLFRDPSAWYHIVVAASGSSSLNVYVNGVQVTAFSTNTNPDGSAWLFQSGTIRIGSDAYASTNLFDGYLTEVNFIDGQALTPSSFGGYNAGTGVWEPRKYSGTYGTNGFYLNFQDNSAATAAAIGKDSSGNGNNWTPNNISVTAGVTYDSMLDVPTLTSATNANFPTWNPLEGGGNGTFASANLLATCANTTGNPVQATMSFPTSGKWYCEVTGQSVGSSSNGVGIILNTSKARDTSSYFYLPTGQKIINGSVSSYGSSWTNNDVIGIALDMDAGTLTMYKNNTSQGTLSTGVSGAYNLTICGGGSQTIQCHANFGQRPFSYTPPTGFKSLNTFNLPEPTIPSGDDYHKVYTYTGNGGGLQVGEIQKPSSLFNLDRSIRIRAAQNAYFSRLPTTNGNGQKFTISTWVKRGELGTGWTDTIFTGRTGTNFPELDIMFANDIIKLQAYTTGAALLMNVDTVNTYRNPAIWYHIVTAFDTTQTTPADRVKVYVNGIQQTIAAGVTYPSQNLVLNANQTVTQYIGSSPANTAWGDLYFADYYMIDGQQLTPTDFGQFDGNNYWTPKAYTGTYGTNGFHLEFEDFSAATASAIGKDTSGNGNNWTPTGINLTAPANTNTSWDSMVDVPTQTSTDVANFATLNPLTASNIGSGNLQVTGSSTGTVNDMHISTIPLPSTGKWYCEMSSTAYNASTIVGWIGVMSLAKNRFSGLQARVSGAGAGYFSDDVLINNVNVGALNDVFGVAADMDNRTLRIYINGTIQATVMSIPSNVDMYFAYGTYTSGTGWVNFGQRPFKYSNYGVDRPAATFKALNSYNIAEVTTDLETPDFVWIKSRSATTGHALFNSVTGVGKYLSSNATTAETTDVNSLIQFNKNGFLLGNAAIVNTSAATYVASAWKAGGTAVTNTAGSITSQVSANQTAGFSIVTWTGTGANATIGHGLGIAPKMILIKSRTVVQDWAVYHSNLTSAAYWLQLNGTGAQNNNATIWNSTAPTSSVFSVGTAGVSNASTSPMVAYCFSEIAGFSKFGSYTGNGSADGPFIYLGFRPRWVMIKCINDTAAPTYASWIIYDSARNTYNVTNNTLLANFATTENIRGVGTGAMGSVADIDFLSNGIKIRGSAGVETNVSNETYIYAAFAENPFKYALAR